MTAALARLLALDPARYGLAVAALEHQVDPGDPDLGRVAACPDRRHPCRGPRCARDGRAVTLDDCLACVRAQP
jgi:hypothetical protein